MQAVAFLSCVAFFVAAVYQPPANPGQTQDVLSTPQKEVVTVDLASQKTDQLWDEEEKNNAL